MTSFPACNKTSSSRKPCIVDKKLLWITIKKSWSLCQNPSWKIAWSAPWQRKHDDVISYLQYTLVLSETKQPRYKVSMDHYHAVMVALSESLFKIAWSAPGGEITMTSYPACNKTSLSRKPCIADKTLLLITIRKSWSLFQNPSWNIAWSALLRRNHDDVISGLQ